jgi:hypothetical protein
MSSLSLSLSNQVQKLISFFPLPVTISLHLQSERDSVAHEETAEILNLKEIIKENLKENEVKISLQPAACCVSTLTYLKSFLHTPYGLFGALNLLAQRFKWGFGRCDYLCQCISQADNLDCGSGMALALTVLRSFKGDHLLATVQLVIGHSRFNTYLWKHLIQKDNPFMTKEELRQKMIWIEEDCHYHTCIGLISKDNLTGEWSLKVWDYGLWILPSQELNALAPRLAIRVQRDVCHTSSPNSFKWGHLTIPEGVWIDLLPTLANSSFDGNQSSGSFCPRVFISGCHMSGSPCPGVGIARSLHAEYPGADLIAVDTAEDLANGSSDPIFTSRLSFPGVLSSSFSGTYSDWQISLWDLVYDLLTRDPSALFLP